jgi:hypothetical protein
VPTLQGFLVTLAGLGSVLMITLCAQLPAGVVPAWLHGHHSIYRTIWPQGWSFFANTANSQTLNVYQLNPGRVPVGSAIALSMSSRDRWGLGRTAAAQFDQALGLASQIPPGYWTACTDPASSSCLIRPSSYRTINKNRPGLLCGLLAFVRRAPSAAASGTADKPGLVAVIDVSCPG